MAWRGRREQGSSGRWRRRVVASGWWARGAHPFGVIFIQIQNSLPRVRMAHLCREPELRLTTKRHFADRNSP
jgi:hypothetical protein